MRPTISGLDHGNDQRYNPNSQADKVDDDYAEDNANEDNDSWLLEDFTID